MSYSVVQRRREIGLRIALGATLRNVTALMVREAAIPIGMGFVVGLAAPSGLTRFLQSLLFEMETTDPFVFIGATIILGFAGLVAAFIPARKSSRVDPIYVLRFD